MRYFATRWWARADSIRAVWSSFDEITRGLEELEDSDDNKTKAKAENLLARVRSFQFIVMIMFMKSVMIKTKILTKQVQSVNINIVDTLQSSKVTISTLHHLRDDKQNLNNLIIAVVEFSERHGVDANGEYQRQHHHIFRCESTTSHHRRGRVPTFSLERFGARSERKWNANGTRTQC